MRPERHLRQSDQPPATARPPARRPDTKDGTSGDPWVRCTACGHGITTPDQAMRVNGRHAHAFFNPAGIAYELRCFRTAPGISAEGAPTGEFSWFPGCRWQIALCAACRTHLGWLFTGARSFAGLISGRIRTSPVND